MDSPMTLVPRLLRDPAAYFEGVRRSKNLSSSINWLLVSSVVCLSIYGFVMGLAHSPWQALSSAVKMPILVIGAGLLCLPALYFSALMLGTPLRLAQITAVVLAGGSVMAVSLLGLTPVILIFVLTSRSYGFFQLLIVASVALSGCAGFFYLWRGVLWVNLFGGRLRASVQHMLMGIWLALYAFVGSQMAWRLSPFVGDPDEPFVLLQPSHSNFYVDVTHALERTLGLHGALWDLPPVWMSGICLIPLIVLIVGTGLAAGAEGA
jgi:hypothetical protein